MKKIEFKNNIIKNVPKKYFISVFSRKRISRKVKEKLLELEEILDEINKWNLPIRTKQ